LTEGAIRVDDDDRRQMARELRQRLESLRRAGVDRLPLVYIPSPAASEPARPTIARERELPATPPPPPQLPPRPAPASLFGEAELEGPTLSLDERRAALAQFEAEVAVCTRCPHLAAARTQTVFGEGNPAPRLMFVGEAPGADEDRLGRPFVGRAGMLLTDMITKGMGLAREDVYIANVLKCRPPENRTPMPDEVAHCLPFLERQIEIIRPEFLCLLGRAAVQALMKTAVPMGRLRGQWHRYKSIPTLVTWHPAYLLRNPAAKKDSWEDLQMLMQAMGIKPPERRRD
jgi:DNA polymerase